MGTPAAGPPRRTAHRILTALGAIGIVALLLPFSFDIVPYQALLERESWQLALPAHLAILITIMLVWWVRVGALPRWARVTGYALGTASATCTLSIYIPLDQWPGTTLDLFALVAPPVVLLFGSLLLARLLKLGHQSEYAPILAMQTAYIANAMIALAAGFQWGAQIGAYAVVVTVIAYAVQIDLVRKSVSGRNASVLS